MNTYTVTSDIQHIEDAHTSGAYHKRTLAWARGAGCTIWDEAGNPYLDLTSGQGVALLGHANPIIAQAIAEQANTLITCPDSFYNERRARLYTALMDILPAGFGRFFLCNSGAEAIEGALKVARLLTGRRGIVALKRGFHGRTMGALGLTWNKDYREPFSGWTPEPIAHLAADDYEAAETLITEETAAVVVEAAQGEGGVYPLSAEWLGALRRLCDERGALLIADEIQTGLGRTGRWFAFEHSAIVPDIIAMGKGIAGGLPMGVIAWRAALGTLPIGSHGSTFGGNPLACAAAIATLDELRRIQALQRAEELGAWLLEHLRAISSPAIREVRGLGLMVGVELRGRVTPLLQALQARGILALPSGKTVLRWLPPLIITQQELERALTTLEEALNDLNS